MGFKAAKFLTSALVSGALLLGHPGIVVDNFAGGGGASTAMEEALERHVDIAINHDERAIAMHKRNHPNTEHYCENVWDVVPSVACAGRPIDVAWFSPDCKHFSRAAGGTPKDKSIRGLAWVVLKWAALPEWQRPKVIFLENVEEFRDWQPVAKNGKIDKRYAKGSTFRKWRKQIEALGYKVEYQTLRADDFGAATIRKRLFLVARCDGLPIVFPQPTHGDPKKDPLGVLNLKPWKPASSIVDWSVQGKSIFDRKKPLAENTQRRIAAGLNKFVINNPEPFIVPLSHNLLSGAFIDRQFGSSTGSSPENDITRPLGTVMTKGSGKSALVAPIIQHVAHSKAKNGCMPADQPLRTITARPKGGSLAVTTAWMAQHNTGVVGRDMNAPLSTIVGRGTQQQAVTVDLVDDFATQDRRESSPTQNVPWM